MSDIGHIAGNREAERDHVGEIAAISVQGRFDFARQSMVGPILGQIIADPASAITSDHLSGPDYVLYVINKYMYSYLPLLKEH